MMKLPPLILDTALSVLDSVDVAITEAHVSAPVHYVPHADSLGYAWRGRILLQLPDDGMLGQWVERLIQGYKRGTVAEAVAVLSATPGAGWYHLARANNRCFIDGSAPILEKKKLPYPVGVLYLGSNTSRFIAAFAELGEIEGGESEDAPIMQVRELREEEDQESKGIDVEQVPLWWE